MWRGEELCFGGEPTSFCSHQLTQVKLSGPWTLRAIWRGKSECRGVACNPRGVGREESGSRLPASVCCCLNGHMEHCSVYIPSWSLGVSLRHEASSLPALLPGHLPITGAAWDFSQRVALSARPQFLMSPGLVLGARALSGCWPQNWGTQLWMLCPSYETLEPGTALLHGVFCWEVSAARFILPGEQAQGVETPEYANNKPPGHYTPAAGLSGH